MSRPIVALVGRPNVGKSTLFNRLAGQRLAVVDDEPGTTRDRLFATVEWNGRIFALVDTGGIEGFDDVVRPNPLATGSADFLAEIRAQTEMAIADADVIIFMAEANVGVTATDAEIADLLRRRQKSAGGVRRPPVLLAVNKGDNPERRAMAANFYELGLGDPVAISAVHGIGTGDLLDEVVALLPVRFVLELWRNRPPCSGQRRVGGMGIGMAASERKRAGSRHGSHASWREDTLRHPQARARAASSAHLFQVAGMGRGSVGFKRLTPVSLHVAGVLSRASAGLRSGHQGNPRMATEPRPSAR